MELVLDLVLEYVDIQTLLNCIFLSKHTHVAVMCALAPELSLIRKLSAEYVGYVFGGLWANWELARVRPIPYSEKMHVRVLHVYAKLYTFKELTVTIHDLTVPKRFLADMCILVYDYYHKLPKNLILNIFKYVFDRYTMSSVCSCKYGHDHLCEYVELAKFILDKGFDVNSRIDRYDKQTTLLIYAVYNADIVMIDILLDKYPDMYLTNHIEDDAVTAMDAILRSYITSPGVYRDVEYVHNVLHKFDRLAKMQKY